VGLDSDRLDDVGRDVVKFLLDVRAFAAQHVPHQAHRVPPASTLQANPEVAVVGNFKAGKSTFVNEWLGEIVAPVDALPQTAKVTKFVRGPERSARIWAGGAWYSSSIEEIQLISAEQPTHPLMPRQLHLRDTMQFAEVSLPTPKLGGITFVDTPGLNSGSDDHDRVTLEYLSTSTCSAVLWLMTADKNPTAEELETVKQLCGQGRKVILVGTKGGKRTPQDRKDKLEHWRKNYRHTFHDFVLTTKAEDRTPPDHLCIGNALDERVFAPIRRDANRAAYASAVERAIEVVREAGPTAQARARDRLIKYRDIFILRPWKEHAEDYLKASERFARMTKRAKLLSTEDEVPRWIGGVEDWWRERARRLAARGDPSTTLMAVASAALGTARHLRNYCRSLSAYRELIKDFEHSQEWSNFEQVMEAMVWFPTDIFHAVLQPTFDALDAPNATCAALEADAAALIQRLK
jgi:GTP-binding protein EngB required for normal cell division